MSHEIEIVNGKASFFSARGITAWHGLGTVVQSVKTAREAMELAGLDWQVNLEKVFTADGLAVPGTRVTRRSTDGRVLGTVGDRYRPLQNTEAFDFFDAFVQAGEATYETAGSLRNGERVWILAKLNREAEKITDQIGDEIEKYVLLSNGHDGTLACRVGYTSTRVVCANTMAAAHNSDSSQLIRLRHGKNIVQNLKDIRTTMDLIDGTFKATADMYRTLAKAAINPEQLEAFVKLVTNDDGDSEDGPKKSTSRILDLYNTAAGQPTEDSWYKAINAVTAYTTHEAGRTEDNRLNSLAYGQGGNMNQAALQYAYNYVTTGAF